VVLLQNGHELEEGVGPAHIQLVMSGLAG